MKLTTLIACATLVLCGICALVYAVSGVDLLALVTAHHALAYRAALGFCGICALWLLFWLIAFRPTRALR